MKTLIITATIAYMIAAGLVLYKCFENQDTEKENLLFRVSRLESEVIGLKTMLSVTNGYRYAPNSLGVKNAK